MSSNNMMIGMAGLTVSLVGFGVGYLLNRYLGHDLLHKVTKREEELFKEVNDPSIKKAYTILRSEREELLAQLQESDAKAKKVISEIRKEREELLSQLMDKSEVWTLTYFDTRGRAEQIRLLFAVCGISFTDTRIKPEDWKTLKSNTPMGRLPVLEHNGRKFGESIAQIIYLAKAYDRWPKNPEAEAVALMVIFATEDLRNDLIAATFCPPDKTAQASEKLTNHLKDKLPFFQNLLTEHGFFTSSCLTAADVVFFDALDQIIAFNPKLISLVEDYPEIVRWRQRIAELPNVANYLKERK